MSNFNKTFVPEYQYTLNSITYTLDSSDEEVTNNRLLCLDTVTVSDDNDHARYSLSRELFFQPCSPFKLEISFFIDMKYREKVNKSSLNDEKLIKMLFEEGYWILEAIYSRISLLISQITSSYGQSPIITPPSYYEEHTLSMKED